MTQYSTVRYPQMPNNVDPVIRDTFSELIRTLEVRDKDPLKPYEVYGRTIEANATNLTSLGYINTGTPDGGFWNVYEYQVERDVGTVVITSPDVSPRVQVRVYLPKAEYIEGRTISILYTTNGITYPLNVGVYTQSGDSFILYPEVADSVSVKFTPAGAMPAGLPLYGYVAPNSFGAGIPAGPVVIPIGTFDAGAGAWYGPISDLFTVTTTVNSNPVYTFRAHGNIWYQIP